MFSIQLIYINVTNDGVINKSIFRTYNGSLDFIKRNIESTHYKDIERLKRNENDTTKILCDFDFAYNNSSNHRHFVITHIDRPEEEETDLSRIFTVLSDFLSIVTKESYLKLGGNGDIKTLTQRVQEINV